MKMTDWMTDCKQTESSAGSVKIQAALETPSLARSLTLRPSHWLTGDWSTVKTIEGEG